MFSLSYKVIKFEEISTLIFIVLKHLFSLLLVVACGSGRKNGDREVCFFMSKQVDFTQAVALAPPMRKSVIPFLLMKLAKASMVNAFLFFS